MTDGQAGGPSAGRLLRQAREAAGLHVEALAVSLKVPVRKLEALEDDRYDALPDAVFARALASSVCRTLKVDPQPILDRLPQGPTPRLVSEREPINAPFRAPGDGPGPRWVDQLKRPVVLAVLVLLLGALVIIFLPSGGGRDDVAARPAEAPGVPMAAPALPPGVDTPMPPVEAAPQAQGEAPAAAASAPAAATAPIPRASAPSMAAVAAATADPAPAGAAAASELVVFKASGPSWVQVTDAKGTVTLRRLLAAGESAGASGNPPLAVTVGSASATAVEVRGKPYDLANVSKDNVARFEVK